MPLTAEDVSNKRFTTVRLREGYDMTEVDQFLDEVEAELRRLHGENQELQARLRAAGLGTAPETAPAATDGASPATGVAADTAPATGTSHTVAGPTDQDGGSAPVEKLAVTTTAEASLAATRLLEIAGRSADQLVAEAEERADRIVGEAKSTAEQLESGARSRAEALETETEERRMTLVAGVEEEKARLDAEIDKLRTFEREYRAELRTYFAEQLAALDGHGAGGVLGRAADRDDAAPAAVGGESPGDPPTPAW